MLKEAWTVAIETLSWMEMRGLSERLALAKTVKQLNVDDSDSVRLAHLLVCETARRRNFIDKFVDNLLKPEALSTFNLGIQSFLRLYVYQTRIAKDWSRTDVEEASDIAKLGRSILGWKSFQEIEHILGAILTQDPKSVFKYVGDEETVGLLTFHPTWFVKYCFRLFGRAETIYMLEGNLRSPPAYIRLNALRADEKRILERLGEDGVKTQKVDGLQYAHVVCGANQALTRTPSFKDGLFYIQDKASCLAAEVANPKPGMTVLDVCAAPGAKTTYLAQLMGNRGAIYSLDFSRRRMAVWNGEAARMGVEIAEPIIADACNPLALVLKADVVVLDPPCTSTGAFAKLPSAKWRLTRRSVGKMAEIQWKMLDNCAENVKPDGTLVYSTCSIAVEENEMLIERFLKWHSEFSLAETTPRIGLPGLRGLEKCQRLYTHIHQCNGFFIAKLLKSEV